MFLNMNSRARSSSFQFCHANAFVCTYKNLHFNTRALEDECWPKRCCLCDYTVRSNTVLLL